MVVHGWLYILIMSFFSLSNSALAMPGTPGIIKPYKRAPLQDLVTWDEHSLFVRGERIMLYSGDFHPFRLPVPGLWRDIFQKIKALGYNGATFYVDWALLEGNPGHFTAEGVFDFDPFFHAASETGIYLVARPGPYINAEVSGGGFPGWLSRNPAILRTNMSAYMEATQNYVSHIGSIIAKAQITNGGPVILLQPENEYTYGADWITFPDPLYFGELENQYRNAGIVIPLINNDAFYGAGRFVPGTASAVDIYGVDSYPIGFVCAEPYNWSASSIPTDYHAYHEGLSPTTPFSIAEFQSGAIDLLGGPGYDQCAVLTGPEYQRVLNKNSYAAGVMIFNTYMIYGGTNWGNIGEPGAYTSYDYGAAIREDRTLVREKYSEAKLEANFMAVSPAYLTAAPGNVTNATYITNSDVSVTPLWGANKTNFYVVRQSVFDSEASSQYKLSVATSIGNVTIPRFGGLLSLNGRDSKIHVTDYDLGGINLIYSSAEIFTWKKNGSKTVLVLYGGEGETHELALSSSLGDLMIEGSGVKHSSSGGVVTINWQVNGSRRIVHSGNKLDVYLLWRNEAYNYWVLELPAAEPIRNYSSHTKSAVIVRAGYLLRDALITNNSISLTGDINATTDLEVIFGQPQGPLSLYFNGKQVADLQTFSGRLIGSIPFSTPDFNLPSLTDVEWRYLDSLPEIRDDFDDSLWLNASLAKSPNTSRNLTTPTSLYAGDYGYHTGSLLYRGHFVASGNESTFYVETQGGGGFGHSIWINSTFLDSWVGNNVASGYNQTVILPQLVKGKTYVITIVIDHMGTETNWTPGFDLAKTPRGILDYNLAGHKRAEVTWKLTGNLGGEQYRDHARGPLNEGGMYAERQGFHQPGPPISNWSTSSPYQGIPSAGIGFYTTNFYLDFPDGYDIPLSFVFANVSATGNNTSSCDFRVQLYVNGYQFGEYINNIGPQTMFPVPEGVLNYNGNNWVALTLWAFNAAGAKLNGFKLQYNAVVASAYEKPAAISQPTWSRRAGAY